MAFHIDEDAYYLLNDYLTSVKAYFSRQQDAQNIIEDIEARIAELFQEKLSDNKQVISIDDVQQMIHVLGKPSDFGVENGDEPPQDEPFMYKKSKRLYRDHENALLGGVSAGLGAFLNIDPLWPRLLFILLFFASGFGAILYIILWIVVPPARTTAEKLEMKGESITLENIEKSINNEYQKVKQNFDDFRSSKRYQDISDTLTEIVNVIGRILLALLKVAGVIIGVFLIIGGIVALMGITGTIFFDFDWLYTMFDIRISSFEHMLENYTGSDDVTLLLISTFLAAGIPVLVLIYGVIKLIFQIKSNDRNLGLGLFVLWLLAAVFTVYMLFVDPYNFRDRNYHGINQYPEQPFIQGYNNTYGNLTARGKQF